MNGWLNGWLNGYDYGVLIFGRFIMDRITKIFQETQHRFLNLFCMDVRHRNGEASEYYVASRAKSADDLKAVTHRNDPDGVSIYSVYGEQKDQVVLVKQYRYPLVIDP